MTGSRPTERWNKLSEKDIHVDADIQERIPCHQKRKMGYENNQNMAWRMARSKRDRRFKNVY